MLHVQLIQINLCHNCLKGKLSKLSFHSSHTNSVISFQTIHSDLWSPSPCVSIDDYKYYVTFIDEYSRFVGCFLLLIRVIYILFSLPFIRMLKLNSLIK